MWSHSLLILVFQASCSHFVIFSECDDTHYGNDWPLTCSCVAANTRSCDHVDGTCTCNAGWEGTICTDDINECTALTNPCNDPLKTCTNTQGSYECSCISGYRINANLECTGKFIIDFFFLPRKQSPYLGPQYPYQKSQISLFESKKISHVWKVKSYLKTPKSIVTHLLLQLAPKDHGETTARRRAAALKPTRTPAVLLMASVPVRVGGVVARVTPISTSVTTLPYTTVPETRRVRIQPAHSSVSVMSVSRKLLMELVRVWYIYIYFCKWTCFPYT